MPLAAVPRTVGGGPLALLGGVPVRPSPLPYGMHHVEDADVKAVVRALRSSRLTTGPEVEAFEAAFATVVGARQAVAYSSGTAALHGAVFAAGVTTGDEVVTTPLTFCATANCVLYQGGAPVFADVCDDTLTLDPSAAATRVTRRTRALLPVDYAGHPADLEPLMRLAQRYGLVMIEDATHAPGARIGTQRVGSVAHLSVFSFHPVKHLTTGEGGMVTTDDPTLAARLRLFRDHGIERGACPSAAQAPWAYEMTALGYNYRLGDLGCALGRSQLGRLDAMLARRTAIAARYTHAFASLRGVRVPVVRQEVRHAWHLYPIRLDVEALRVDRDTVLRALRAEGIGATVHFPLVYRHPYYRARFGEQTHCCPVAEEASRRLISLPLFPAMSDADTDDVIVAVRKVINAYVR